MLKRLDSPNVDKIWRIWSLLCADPDSQGTVKIVSKVFKIASLREFIFIKYKKKMLQKDYPDNGLKAQSLLAQDRISAPIVKL